jgi:predicted PhzF superfamily epimerase YddE/YHI9
MERLEPGRRKVVFHSASGPLTVRREDSLYVMDFPSRPTAPVQPPPALTHALAVAPLEVLANESSYLAVLGSAQALRALEPNMPAVARLDRGSVIVTAPGEGGYDFVSRFFAPAKGVPEDPVTGSAHCALVPYWSRRLGKEQLRAYQASARGGEIRCRLAGERVELAGSCVFYLEGQTDFVVERGRDGAR